TTDNSGNAYFYLKKGGAYMTAGKRGDSVLFIDTLRIKDISGPMNSGSLGNPLFTIETPVRATGRVRLLSGLEIESGLVMLRGTRITSKLGDSGDYNLGWVPPSAQKTVVTVTYNGRAREQRFVKLSTQGGQLTAHSATTT